MAYKAAQHVVEENLEGHMGRHADREVALIWAAPKDTQTFSALLHQACVAPRVTLGSKHKISCDSLKGIVG